MHSVIIADDEEIIRERLKKCVHWSTYGLAVVGDAANGADALALIKIHKPCLAILDINMPLLNGVELSRIIANDFPDTQIIILTGYSSVDSACASIDNGVFKYLLKPIDMAQLYQALAALSANLVDKAKQKLEQELFHQELHNKRRAYRNEMFQRFLSSKNDLANQNALNEALEGKRFEGVCVVISRVRRLHEVCLTLEERDRWLLLAQTMLEKKIAAYTATTFIGANDCLYTIISSENQSQTNQIADLLREVLFDFSTRFPLELNIAAGHHAVGIMGILASVTSAQAHLQNRLLLSDSHILLNDETSFPSHSLPLSIAQQILQTLLKKDMMAFMRLVDDILHDTGISYRQIKMLVDYALHAIANVCDAKSLDFDSIVSTRLRIDQYLEQVDDLDEIRSFLKITVENLFMEAMDVPISLHTALVVKAKAFIDEQYMDNELSLSSISAAVFANYSHLSSQFKKDMGINLNAYILKKRMEHASILLSSGQSNIKDIAFQVGFQDAYYFSRCFKRYYGISPIQFAHKK